MGEEPWYTLDQAAVLERLETRLDGLTDAEATERLQRFGPNQLEERALRSPWAVLAAQFTEVMVIVLLVAAAISFFIGETTDALMVLIIVVLNAVLGFTQEYRAERAMAALKRLAVPEVKVRRQGQTRQLPATQLVPGDVILLEAGARVPADVRLLESANLRIEESALTGESVPVEKITHALTGENIPLGDRRNMAFMGTTVTYGRGTAVVVETGMRTELGHIADMLQTIGEEKTPLQRRMAELGKWLAVGALIICGVVFAVGVWRGGELAEMFLTAVSLAVAAVPEGLPAVVTIALALGAQRMVRRNALIRKLPAVETLGSVTTICSDKTGTLTENRMTVTVLDVAGRTLNLIEQLRKAGPVLSPDDPPLDVPDVTLSLLLSGGSLCNDATLEPDEEKPGSYRAIGDPTEGALVVAAARMGLWKAELETALPRVAEVPFTSERKRMTTVHKVASHQLQVAGSAQSSLELASWNLRHYVAFTKGAVDGMLEISDRVWVDGEVRPLDDHWRERIQVANDKLAADGMRVLGVAFRPLDELPATVDEDTLERGLIFVGLLGMIDPPRPEVRDAVAKCRTAGIRPVMITGDHPLTALHIARQLGIIAADDVRARAITGQELARMSVDDLEAVVEDVAVYARVSPEHKVKIVEALKRKGHFVAMTGDGVNDAPALKRADIGVAMGITGTDVSKEAADMVLLDDNFATIVAAIEEGRTIYDNIRKFVRYTMSSNVGEIVVMLLAPLLGLPIPLTPLQILWVNLVTDGLPGLALGVEPAEPDTMRRPPHPPGESVLARGMWQYMLWVGTLLGLVSLSVQFWGYGTGSNSWQTMVFTTLCLSQMGNALTIRSDKHSFFSIGIFSNPALIGAVLLTLVLQLAVIYLPFLQGIFKTVSLTPQELAVCLGTSTLVFWAVEAVKWIRQRRTR
ncbi:MAG: cation-translocating P-type ATPase [Anaerolineae bacterium]|nr:cation-translocating P-type ATPase [Anaerolineae bacterium]